MRDYELLEFSYGYEGAQEKSPGLQFAEWKNKNTYTYNVISMCSSISSVGDKVVESLFIMVEFIT